MPDFVAELEFHWYGIARNSGMLVSRKRDEARRKFIGYRYFVAPDSDIDETYSADSARGYFQNVAGDIIGGTPEDSWKLSCDPLVSWFRGAGACGIPDGAALAIEKNALDSTIGSVGVATGWGRLHGAG